MNWYYAVAGNQKGPVVEEEFQRLVQQGAITSQTLVWREGMSNWQPYGVGTPPPIASNTPVGDVVCAGCGGIFPRSEIVRLANGAYCAACKPLGVQRLKEGVSTSSAAEQVRREYLKHEASVKSIGLLYYLGGAGLALMAMATLLAVFGAGKDSSEGEAILMAAVFLLLGAGQIWVGTGLRRLKNWSRIPTGILSGLGLLGFPLGTVINAYILYLIFSGKGKVVFSDEYHAVIEQTPHIKYRTSIIVWILLGLVVLLIAIALMAFFLRPR